MPHPSTRLPAPLALLLKSALVLLVLNEVRGLVLAAPVLYGMYTSGGDGMVVWLGLCTLGGIALSVIVPVVLARKFVLLQSTRSAGDA